MSAEWPDITRASNADLALVLKVAAANGVAAYGGFLTAILAGIYAERERVGGAA